MVNQKFQFEIGQRIHKGTEQNQIGVIFAPLLLSNVVWTF
jgi:hypothetical protein